MRPAIRNVLRLAVQKVDVSKQVDELGPVRVIHRENAFRKKETVHFDPTNEMHRRHYHDFMTSNKWTNCPMKFIVSEVGNSNAIMHRMLLEYYMKQEFIGEAER